MGVRPPTPSDGSTVLIGLLTPVFMEHSPSGTFLVFATACSLGYLWSTYFVPETANISLEEMDAVFGSSVGREDVALKQQVRCGRGTLLAPRLIPRHRYSYLAD